MLLGFLITLALTLPAMAVLRTIFGRRVQALMLRRSPTASPARAASDDAPEIAAATTPRIEQLDDASALLEEDRARLVEGRRARSLFRRMWAYDAAGAIGVVAVAFLVGLAQGAADPQRQMEPDLTGLGLWVILYLILVCLRYVFYAKQYLGRTIRAASGRGWTRRWLTTVFEELFQVAFHPRYALVQLSIFAVGAVYFAEDTSLGVSVAVLAALLALGTLRVYLYRQAQLGTNRRLLILRVFGQDKSTKLTFGSLRRCWQHLGSSFTVVDPSYLRFKYRGHSDSHVAVVFFPLVLIAGLAVITGNVPELNLWAAFGVVFGLAIDVAYLLVLGVMYVRAPRSFATDSVQIQDRLQRFLRRPRRWDLTFKDLDLYCYDNTWQDAVAQCVDRADVILMDLRGYSDQNKGCETEVDALFDTTAINRIVFLVDADADLHIVHRLVCDRWKHLKANSPNLLVPDPVARIYVSRRQNTADVRGLLNTLISGVTRGAEVPA